MKIVHLVPYFHPGLGYEENYMAFAQAALGLEMTIVSSTIPAPGFEYDVPNGEFRPVEEDVDGVHLIRLPSRIRLRSSSQIQLKGLKSTIARYSPDLIHVHNPVGLLSLQGLWAARKLRLPVVLDSHINYHNLGDYGIVKRLYYRLFKRIILPYFRPQIKVVIPITPDNEQVLIKELGVNPASVIQVPLGTDSKTFTFDASARERVRQQFQIRPDTAFIVFAGQIIPAKGINVLLRAIASIPASADVKVVIVGPADSGYGEHLKSLSAQLGVDNRVSFVGPWRRHELPGLYSAADIGCWPGAAAVSTLDAMSCGLPIVLTRSEMTRHLLSTGGATIFEPGDPLSLSRVLSELVSNRNQLLAMRQNARDQIDSVFRWDQIAERTKTIYEAVIGGRKPDLQDMWQIRNERGPG